MCTAKYYKTQVSAAYSELTNDMKYFFLAKCYYVQSYNFFYGNTRNEINIICHDELEVQRLTDYFVVNSKHQRSSRPIRKCFDYLQYDVVPAMRLYGRHESDGNFRINILNESIREKILYLYLYKKYLTYCCIDDRIVSYIHINYYLDICNFLYVDL